MRRKKLVPSPPSKKQKPLALQRKLEFLRKRLKRRKRPVSKLKKMPRTNALKRKRPAHSLLNKKQRLLAWQRKPQRKPDFSRKRLKKRKMPASKLKRMKKTDASQKKQHRLKKICPKTRRSKMISIWETTCRSLKKKRVVIIWLLRWVETSATILRCLTQRGSERWRKGQS